MTGKLAAQLAELFISALVAGLTTSAGLLALVHESNWLDSTYVFVVPFLSTISVGLRNLYKSNPSTERKQ